MLLFRLDAAAPATVEGRITKVPYAEPGLATPGFLLFRVDHWQVRTRIGSSFTPRLLPPLSVALAAAGAAVATSIVEAAAAATVDDSAAAASRGCVGRGCCCGCCYCCGG